ncbi:MAG: PEGA domain-containing protein [Vicinamibacterales bacterium]
MSSAGRPDSWIYLSDSTGHRREAASAARGDDASLSEFTSETTPQTIVVPAASIVSRRRGNDVTASAWRIPNSRFQPRALRQVASNAIRIPLWMGRVRDMRRLAKSTTFIAFAGGAAAGVLVRWFVGAQPPWVVAPSTIPAVKQQPAVLPPDLQASPPDLQPPPEATRADSTWLPSSIATTAARPIGTSGRSARDLKRAPRASRIAAALSAKPARATVARAGSYQGSLAFLSAPQGARVFVNGAFVGSTPLVLDDLPVGSRAVRIEADGYQRWSSSTQVVANRQTRVSATLGRAGQ